MLQTEHTANADAQQAKPLKPVADLLAELYTLIAPTWPLDRAVACNPLQGLESLPFAEATRKGQDLFDANCLPTWTQLQQAQDQGQLPSEAFEAAQQRAWADEPGSMPLGEKVLPLAPVGQALVKELKDWKVPQQVSPLTQQAVSHLKEARLWPVSQEAVNRACVKWLGAFVDQGQAAWPMPYRDRGLFGAVKALLALDPKYTAHQTLWTQLPDQSLEAIRYLLGRMGVGPQQRRDWLRDHLLALPGWASFIRWRSEQNDYEPQQAYPVSLTDYVALRLLLQHLGAPLDQKVEPALPPELKKLATWAAHHLQPGEAVLPEQWAEWLSCLQRFQHHVRLDLLARWENQFRHELTQQLISQAEQPGPDQRPDAQAVFCIDVRSEPFRRQLEQTGAYETFGFAGFFGQIGRAHV
jgi:uncharacterized protein